ncbi:MLP-like protein 28 [Andrographis paniculata]|uniref:MLP-like protein 28 n=1 Tax=Andrographis paniculata TaxID=175694 RepID=UPI0021E83FEC|nr:MLP-like protein 28 [Andrographis paniculata]
MAQMSEIIVSVKTSVPPQYFYNFLKYDATKVATRAPMIVKESKLISGQEGQVGNIKLFVYFHGPITKTVKLETTGLYDKEKMLSFKVIEHEEIQQLYPYFMVTAIFKEGSVDWKINYEKASPITPKPIVYAQLLVQVTEALEPYLIGH